MLQISENDRTLIGYLQKQGSKTVSELAELMGVTETAIRQRLSRLIALGLVTRIEEKAARGRPVHKYLVTREGRSTGGQNFADLASVVWEEVRSIEDSAIRSKLVRGIARRLAARYRAEIDALAELADEPLTARKRADLIARFFESRGIPVTVNQSEDFENRSEDIDELLSSGSPPNSRSPESERQCADSNGSHSKPFPILKLHGCPYPGLSESDELICEMEQSMFSELSGCDVELHRCDPNRSECCAFQLEPVERKG